MPSSTGLEHRYLKHETPTPPPLQICFKKKISEADSYFLPIKQFLFAYYLIKNETFSTL